MATSYDLPTIADVLADEPPLRRCELLAEALHAAAAEIGLSAAISLHGSEWPAGLAPTGPLIVTCIHGLEHHAHRSAVLGTPPIGVAMVIIGRPATDAEVAAKQRHDAGCPLFRAEDWQEGPK